MQNLVIWYMYRKDYKQFMDTMTQESQRAYFWYEFIQLMEILKDLVRADYEGNWSLHLHTAQRLLSLFAVFDKTNYLHWCSLYLEDILTVEETAPDVHSKFCEGYFVVKRTPRLFKAVGADTFLE